MQDDEAAYQMLEAQRWPDGPVCPHCGSVNRAYFLAPRRGVRTTRTGKTSARRMWKCGQCRKQFSVLVGTPYKGSHVPLSKWLQARDTLEATPNMSTLALAHDLKTTYRTAQRIRRQFRSVPGIPQVSIQLVNMSDSPREAFMVHVMSLQSSVRELVEQVPASGRWTRQERDRFAQALRANMDALIAILDVYVMIGPVILELTHGQDLPGPTKKDTQQ